MVLAFPTDFLPISTRDRRRRESGATRTTWKNFVLQDCFSAPSGVARRSGVAIETVCGIQKSRTFYPISRDNGNAYPRDTPFTPSLGTVGARACAYAFY